MTASITTSVAILKRRYKDGVPKTQFTQAKFMATAKNDTTFVGEDLVLALQNENPQGLGTTVGTAIQSLSPSQYNRFALKRKSYYGVARITGEALKAATERGGGALVDLWTNEMDSVSAQVLEDLEVSAFGNGSGVRGQIASGQGTPTIQLTKASDAAKFKLGMRVAVVSDASLSPTVRATGTSAPITAIDRAAGTITIAGNWSTVITGTIAGDYLVRSGDQALAGTHQIPAGLRQWVVGGSTPGSFNGLNRNVDPVRLAGQVYDGTGVPMEQAVIEMDSLLSTQGQASQLVLWVNPRDVRKIKQSLTGKTIYDKAKVESRFGNISFEALQFEGDNGNIRVLQNPFVTEGEAFLTDMSSVAFYSAGEAPMILNFDSNDFLRVSAEDAYEVRFGYYGDWGVTRPVSNIRAVNFGV